MKMKSKKLALLFLSVLLVLSILPMSALAASRNLTEGAKAYIQVTNAVENDQLAAYKIIDTTYDAATNTLTHAWNSDFAAYFAGTSYSTVEAFSALTDESAELKALLADLPQYIEDNSIAAVDTQTVAVQTCALPIYGRIFHPAQRIHLRIPTHAAKSTAHGSGQFFGSLHHRRCDLCGQAPRSQHHQGCR